MLVRLPTAAEYALAVTNEHRWLPQLAATAAGAGSNAAGTGRPERQLPAPVVGLYMARGGACAPVRDHRPGYLATLADRVDTAAVDHIWQTALQAPWNQRPVWFHGDIAPGNLLVRDGKLAAIIDFGTCGVGDPACDLAIAWTLLSGQGREILRHGLDIDAGTWAPGRGWALWKTLVSYAAGAGEDSADRAEDQRVLAEILHSPE